MIIVDGELRLLCAALACAYSIAACSTGPTTPDVGASALASIELTCPGELLVGQIGFCFTRAYFTSGLPRLVTPNWSSSQPAVASIADFSNAGLITTFKAGQTVISTQYGDKTATAQISVRAEDFLTMSASSIQGTFLAGRVVTLTVQGYYGVASANTGSLRVDVTDQDGKIIAAGTPRIVDKGGGSYLLSSTLTIPTGVTKVCRAAILEIGSVKFEVVGGAGLLPCIAVGPS